MRSIITKQENMKILFKREIEKLFSNNWILLSFQETETQKLYLNKNDSKKEMNTQFSQNSPSI